METESGSEGRTLAPAAASSHSTFPAGAAIPPLSVTGLVVTKTDLVRALRIYVPQLVDFAAIDGESFMLKLATTSQKNGRS